MQNQYTVIRTTRYLNENNSLVTEDQTSFRFENLREAQDCYNNEVEVVTPEIINDYGLVEVETILENTHTATILERNEDYNYYDC